MLLTTPEATEQAGRILASTVTQGDVIALSGPLGAGKTSFTRGLIAALGFPGEVPSPTFAIIIPYAPPETRIPVWHIDLYRIENPRELDELGLDDARNDAALVIEWPERLGARLWPDALRIDLAVERVGRRLTATAPPSWEGRWPLR